MSLSVKLIEITDVNRHAIEAIPQMQDMLQGRFSRQRYINFLTQLYPLVSHFCPLMARAASHSADRYDQLRDYLYDHVQEERGHEQLVLNDLESLMFDASAIPQALPQPPVQVMLGYNYHAIDNINPHAVIGMIYVLEIVSSVYGGQVADAVSRAIDYPLSKGFSFLTSHTELDESHMSELRNLVQGIRQPEIEAIVLNSVQTNFYLFRQLLNYPVPS